MAGVGDLTAAQARDDEVAIEHIASVTGLDQPVVAWRLGEVHGNTLVRNVFAEWPKTPETAGRVRVKQARDAGLVGEIAEITGLSEQTIRRRLRDCHGRTTLRTLFADVWPEERAERDLPEAGLDDVDVAADAIGEGVDSGEGDVDGAERFRDAFAPSAGGRAGGDPNDDPDDEDDGGDDDPGADELDSGADAGEREGMRGAVGAPAADEGAAAPAEVVIARLRLDPGGAWSRPRALVAVMRAVGHDVPQRLRKERFQRLVADLAAHGVQMRLADEERPLSTCDASPGKGARVRLRVAGPPATGGSEPDWQGATSTPPPIVVVPSPPRQPMPPVPAASDYELAVLRLQFLTAVPWIERQRDPDWPNAFLEAAFEGLVLEEQERRRVRMAAASYVRGTHSPDLVIKDLVSRAAHEDLDRLLERFLHLNRHMPEAAAEVVRQVNELRAAAVSGPLPTTSPSPPVPAHPLSSSPVSAPVVTARRFGVPSHPGRVAAAGPGASPVIGTFDPPPPPPSSSPSLPRPPVPVPPPPGPPAAGPAGVTMPASPVPRVPPWPSWPSSSAPGAPDRPLPPPPRPATPVPPPFSMNPVLVAPQPSSGASEAGGAKNERDLGPLSDMFDD